MKRWGVITLLAMGFVAGITFVYSCGGGGTSGAAVPTSGFISVSFTAAVAEDSDVDTKRVTNHFDTLEDWNQFANADTAFWWEGRALPSYYDSTVSTKVYVPIQLPNGAIIDEFGLIYYDEKDDAFPVAARLRRNVGKPRTVAAVTTLTTSYTPQTISTVEIREDLEVVDNAGSSYSIQGVLYGGADTALISAFVKYYFP